MKITRSITSPLLPRDGCVMTIGNFDGVHRGHKKIMQQLVQAGKSRSLPTVVITFSPGPDEFFQGDNAAPRITTISSRYFMLDALGIDFMLALPFNRQLSRTTAEEFIQKYILEKLQARYVLVGDDFRFGKGRVGDFSLLSKRGTENGFDVEKFQTVMVENERVSSTRIRETLAAGNLRLVKNLLGQEFFMTGRVCHGDKRGREWGFPTLNIPISWKLPMTGVFIVKVTGVAGKTLSGVANLGKRPTIDGIKTLLEVHLFDFNQEIYGKRICVQFIQKLRDVQKFDSFDALKTQIMADCTYARTILGMGP